MKKMGGHRCFIITEMLILIDTEWDLLHMQKNKLLSFKFVNLMLFVQINNTFESEIERGVG